MLFRSAGNGQVWLSDFKQTWLTDNNGNRLDTLDRGFWSAARGRDGRQWLAGTRGIWRADTPGTLIAPPAFPRRDDALANALTEDASGALWAAFLNHPLHRYRQGTGRWDTPYQDLPQARIMALLADSQDRLWIGYQDNRIALVERGAIRIFDAGDGLRLGNVLAIVERHGQLWMAGEQGVARYDGRRFVALRTMDGRELRGISGMLSTIAGDLWLRGHDGVFRIGADQVQGFERTGAKVQYELLGSEEGLGGNVQPTGPFPSMVQATDGRLWVSGTSGAMLINPAAIRHDALPPTVEISALTSDGKPHNLAARMQLPTGTNNLHLTFTAPGLSVAERLRFRYRLQGVDDGWQDAGDRREAFYTNMAPGDYRFQVIAANRDGVWNTAGAAVDIAIPPTFWESLWFKALCALAVLEQIGRAHV